MACQCGCATDTPTPDAESRPADEGERRDLERIVQELEGRVKKLEAGRAAA